MNNLSKFDILKSDQKDKFYRTKLNQATETLLPPIQANLKRNDLKLISDLIYYGTTTLANRQTIGQESHNLILYKEKTKSSPRARERGFLIAFRLVLPYIISKLNRPENGKNKFALSLATLFLFYAKKINLIIFYLSKSSYFNLENRIASVKLLSINLFKKPSEYQRKMYFVFGMLELAMILVHAVNETKKLVVSSNWDKNQITIEDEVRPTESMARLKCPLCLDQVCYPTLTSCGHVFCWYCVNEYVKKSGHDTVSKCPTCRNLFENKRVIYLFNFN